jgi:hypothetical protein
VGQFESSAKDAFVRNNPDAACIAVKERALQARVCKRNTMYAALKRRSSTVADASDQSAPTEYKGKVLNAA